MRLVLCALALACLLPAVVRVARRMPAFGAHPLPYGDAVNRIGPAERHVTNMVSAVNFDIRGIDTLGEEFMLLCAVTGAVVLLRGGRGEDQTARPERVPDRPIPPRSDAVALTCRATTPLLVVFGIYIALHATVTPGGGFQGGVILASAALLVWLGEGYETWRRLIRSRVLDAAEGGGATLYALAGFASMAAGRAFLTNILPLGNLKDVFSGGLMLVENAGVTLAVAGGFALLFLEFLEETRAEKDDAA